MSFLGGFDRVLGLSGTFKPIWALLGISLFFGGLILLSLLRVRPITYLLIANTFFLFIFGAAQISTCVQREEMNLWHRTLTEKSDYCNLLDGEGRLDEKYSKSKVYVSLKIVK